MHSSISTSPSELLDQVTPASIWKSKPRRIFDADSFLSSPTPLVESTRYEVNKADDATSLHQEATASSSVLNLEDMSLSMFDGKLPKKVLSEPVDTGVAGKCQSTNYTPQATSLPDVKSRIPRLFKSSFKSSIDNVTATSGSSRLSSSSSSSGSSKSKVEGQFAQAKVSNATYVMTHTPVAMGEDCIETSLAEYLRPVDLSAVSDASCANTYAEDTTLNFDNVKVSTPSQDSATGSAGKKVSSRHSDRSKLSAGDTSALTDGDDTLTVQTGTPLIETVGSATSGSPASCTSAARETLPSINLMEFSSPVSKLTPEQSSEGSLRSCGETTSDSKSATTSNLRRSAQSMTSPQDPPMADTQKSFRPMTDAQKSYQPMTDQLKLDQPKAGMQRSDQAMTGIQKLDWPMTGIQRSSSPITGIQRSDQPITDTQKSSRPMTSTQRSSSPITGIQRSDQPLTGTRKSDQLMTGIQSSGSLMTGMRRSDQPIAGMQKSDQPMTGAHRSGSPMIGAQRSGSPMIGAQRSGSSVIGVQRFDQPMAGTQQSDQPMTGAHRSGSPMIGAQRSGSPMIGAQRSGSPMIGAQRSGSPMTPVRTEAHPRNVDTPKTVMQKVNPEATGAQQRDRPMTGILRLRQPISRFNAPSTPHSVSPPVLASKESSRSVSPIDIRREDELDSHSESGWSAISELSETSKPVYSDSALQALISGENQALYGTCTRKGAVPPSESAAEKVLKANMALINSRRTSGSTGGAPSSSTHSGVLSNEGPSADVSDKVSVPPDSFFDVNQTRMYNQSTLAAQAEVDLEGLSYQSSALFNTGQSIASLKDISSRSRTDPADLAGSSGYERVLKQTVYDRLFDDSEDITPISDPPRCHSQPVATVCVSKEGSDTSSASNFESFPPPIRAETASLERDSSLVKDNSATTNNPAVSNTEHPSFSSLDAITPGNPVCASSHIIRSDVQSPSERSTHYLSIADKSKKVPSGQSSIQSLTLEQKEDPQTSAQIQDWLSTQCDVYTTQSDPVTIQQGDDASTLCASHNHNNSNSLRPTLGKISPVVEEAASTTAPSLSSNYPVTLAHQETMLNHCDNTGDMLTILCSNEQTTLNGGDSTICAIRSSPAPVLKKKALNVSKTLVAPGVHCTRTNTNIELPVSNACDRWLQVAVTLDEHRIDGQLCTTNVLFFKQADSLIKPLITDVIPIWINTAVAGRHELSVTLAVKGDEFEPAHMRIGIEMEEPVVELVENSDGILNFGAVPYGCVRNTTLTLSNKSRVSVSLLLKVTQDAERRAVVGMDMEHQATGASQSLDYLRLTLAGALSAGGGHMQTIFVNNRTPARHGKAGSPETIRARIGIYQSSAMTGDPMLTVDTRCLCGYASVQVPAKYHNFSTHCGPQSEAVEEVPIRNGGDIPINVSLSLSNPEHFSIAPVYLSLYPGQQGSYRLTFRSHGMTDYTTSALCKVTAAIEPDGKKCAIDVRGVVDAPTAIPPHIAKLAVITKGNAAPDSKSKLKCAPQVIKFAGVEINDCRYMTLKMLNFYDTPVKLNMDIDKSEFQISILIDGVEQLVSAKQVILPVSQSESDTYPIRIAFEPRQLGSARARLKGHCGEKNITFRIPIYGYGGPSLIEPALDSTPSPGVYSVSAGDLHNRDSYQHSFFLRNVGYRKGFVTTQCYSGPGCTEVLESCRIEVSPSPLVVSPADARKVTLTMRITERERVLSEKSKDVIATVKVFYVDQILRQLLHRQVAVHPELSDSTIRPFLIPCSEDRSDLEMTLPDESSSVSLFKSSVKSFIVNIYGEPRSPKAVSNSQPPAASLSHAHLISSSASASGLVVSTCSLTFLTIEPKETQELCITLRNRSTADIPLHFSKLYSPFKCKSKESILRSKNRGTLRIQFKADSLGQWEETLSISSSENVHSVRLIGKCIGS